MVEITQYPFACMFYLRDPRVLGNQPAVLSLARIPLVLLNSPMCFYLITELTLISYFKLQNLFISYLCHMNSKFSSSNCQMFMKLFYAQINYAHLLSVHFNFTPRI
jgi:hypothetical protein